MFHLRHFLFSSAALCVLAACAATSATTTSPVSTIGSILTQELSQKATRQITDRILEQLQDGTANSDNNNNNVLPKEGETRHLQSEDFNEFRELFRRAIVALPDFETSQNIVFANLNLNARNVRCFEIVFSDVQITYALVSPQQLNFRLDINDLDLMCSLDYEWTYSFFNGEGNAKITLNDNYASTVLAFTSEDFNQFPPNGSRVESCSADISISDMEFSGSVTDQVLNVFESLMRGFVEDAVSSTLCEEMDSLGTTLVQDMIAKAGEVLQPYLETLPPEETDAMAAEAALVVPPEIKLMNFQEEGDDQTWFQMALKEVDSALGVWLIDPNTPREGGKDLGVNIALRGNMLDENRAFVLNVADLPFNFDPVLFSGHDQMTETTITLDTVRIYGLDTFNRFEPFINKGKYTLENDLSWDFLAFELDVTLDMKPSTQPDSLILDPDQSMHIIEKATMKIGVDDINATVSLMMAIDQDAFGALRLGPLLHEDNLMPCFMSSVFRSEVTVLTANVANIREPAIEGFIDKGIDNIITNAVKAAFTMYESVVIRALPNIFQITVKGMVNEEFLLSYDEPCPEPIATEGYIDFRDLLVGADEALALGGTGTVPYGSMASSLFGFVKTQIATLEADGTLSANDMFIRPFTRDQSGEEGVFHLPGDLFSITGSDIDFAGMDVLLQGFKLALSNVRAENLDTMVPPFKFLDPTSSAHALSNEVHFGPVSDRPLNVSAHLSVAFGDGSPFSMDNDIRISMTSSAFEIFAEIVARVQAMALLNFPISDLLNFQCWLATIPAPALNELGLRVDPADERGIELKDFVNRFVDMNVNVECTHCSSPGLNMFPVVLQLMSETDVTKVLASRMRFLVKDVVVSDTFQTVIDRLLDTASMSCPHSPAYTSDQAAIGVNFAELPIPNLSETSIDTVEFVMATALQLGFVVFTQMFADTEVNPGDPLVEQAAFKIPEGSNLVNFTNFAINLPSFLQTAYDGLVEMVTGTRIDPATGEEDLSVNIFVRDFFGPEGVFELPLDGMAFGPDEMKIEFYSIRMEGLDSFQNFKIAVPVAPQTILNDIAMEKLAVQLDFGIRSGDVSQPIKLAFRFDDLSASVPLFAAIDKDLLTKLQLGSLLEIANFLPCFFSATYGFSFPQMLINVGTIHKPTFEGLMAETSASLTTLVDKLFEQYGEAMHTSLPSVFDNAIRPILNTLFDYYVTGSGRGCPNPLLNTLESARKLMRVAGPPFIDFRDMLLTKAESVLLGGRGDSRYGDLIRSVWGLIEEKVLEVDATTGVAPINTEIIAPLTSSTSDSPGPGDLYFPGDLLNEEMELAFGPIPTGITFRVSDARVENLDTIGNPFSLLDPVKDRPSLLNNTATIGVGQPLRFGVSLLVDINADGKNIKNDFDITADFHTATLVLAALLKVSEYRFAAFPLGDVFNTDCWLATLPAPDLNQFGLRPDGVGPSAAMEELIVSIQELDLNITCRECSSPGLEQMAELWSTPKATEDITNTANDLLEYLATVLGKGLLQTEMDRMLNDAARRCPHSPEYQQGFTSFEYQAIQKSSPEDEQVSLVVLVMVVSACLVAILGVLVFVIRFIVRRRHGRWVKTLPNEQLMLLKQRQEAEEEKEAELNANTQSMFMSCDVPLWIRWIIPVIILGNIAFFLSGHLSLGAEVKIEIGLAGQVMSIEQFYQFSMARSTVEIWEAGGKQLAILILIFSGIWPYTKQLITLVLWFLPPRICSISRRGSILLWLDTLAKWSIVDIFTLVVSIAAFRVSVQSPSLGFLPDNFYSVDLLVVPMWGLYANMIAQLISQISSHFIIHYHRNIVHQATKAFKHKHGLVAASTINLALTERSEASNDSLADDPYGDRKDLLSQHAYSRPHRGEAGKLVVRSYVNALVAFEALVFAVLIIVGCILPSTGLEFLGVLGVAVESGQDWQQAVTQLSVFNLANLMMDQARFVGTARDYLGLGTLSALLIITVLFVPLAQTATLLYQWFVPMAGRSRKRLSVAVEILQAWQYAEVYIISIVVATWQLGPLSTFMINSYCGSFQETFDMLAYFGVLSEDDAQCFRVDASIESAAYILAVAAVILNLLNTFVMNAVRQYFRDRDEVISRAELKERMFNQQEGMTSPKMEDKMSSKDQLVVACDDDDEGLGKTEEQMAADYWQGREEAEGYINPVPVLFTDKFRWLLRGASPEEETNGRGPEPPVGELMGKPPIIASESSTSDEEQPTMSPASASRMTSPDDPDQSLVSTVFLEDSCDAMDNTDLTGKVLADEGRWT